MPAELWKLIACDVLGEEAASDMVIDSAEKRDELVWAVGDEAYRAVFALLNPTHPVSLGRAPTAI